jgi:hypothetical protein
VPLVEVLHFISLNRKSGRLVLTQRGGHGLVLLRDGAIIYAASSSVRETFGSILVARGLVQEKTLVAALELQHASGEEKRLGTVLVEMGVLTHEQVEEAVRYQTGVVLAELCQWRDGYFRLEAFEIPSHGEIAVDAQDFVVTRGLNTERLLLEVATTLDESGLSEPDTEPPLQTDDAGLPDFPAPNEFPQALSGLLTEVAAPILRGEVTARILREAEAAVTRGVLLLLRRSEAVAVGCFGVDRPGLLTDQPLTLSLSEASVLTDVLERREAWRGPLLGSDGNLRLLEALGAQGLPRESVVVPMIVGDRVAMLFYGDTGVGVAPLGSLSSLEMLMVESSLEMERETLEARQRTLARVQRGA